MAKPRIPNQKKEYRKLNRRLAQYMSSVHAIYMGLCDEVAQTAVGTGYDGEGKFSWSKYPRTRERVKYIQNQFVGELGTLIMSGTSDEWRRSNLLQDTIANKVMRAYHTNKEGALHEEYFRDNTDALYAFQHRTERGMNLSDKLWQQSRLYMKEMEDTISVAVARGTDAVTLSKQLSEYLLDFRKMQDDYTEKFGTASRAQDCEYRSIRLARSEINMAYRTAEQERWRQFDFVVGYEIKTSGSHPKSDMCDKLQGKYPKDFKWTGWHPNCMCYAVPILKTEDEFFSDDQSSSANAVNDVPLQFKEWCYDNSQKIAKAAKRGTLPYILRDNKDYYQELVQQSKGDVLSQFQVEPFYMTEEKMKRLVKEGWLIDFDDPTPRQMKKWGKVGDDLPYYVWADTYNDKFGGLDIFGFSKSVDEEAKRVGIKITHRRLKGKEIYIEGDGFVMRRNLMKQYGENDGDPSTMSVHHSYLQLDEKYQGKGFSKRLFAKHFQLYKKAGFSEVSLEANKDVGGYCWSKYGFMGQKQSVIETLTESHSKGLMTDKQFRMVMKIVDEYDEYIPMQRIAEIEGAKKFMKYAKWDGHIELNDLNQMEYLFSYLGLI